MLQRRTALRASAWLLCAAVLLSIAVAQTAKRPLNHRDYDRWKSISSQRLSNDGQFLAYGLFPQDGDGEVVIRNLVTGKEQREPAGVRPAPAPAVGGEEGPPVARAVTIAFSSDNRAVVFSTFPPKPNWRRPEKRRRPAIRPPKTAW